MARIRVLSAPAIRQGLEALVESFQAETGHAVDLDYASGPNIGKRMDTERDVCDVVVAPQGVIDSRRDSGRFGVERAIPVGGVEAGVAIRTGAPAPDISTADAVREALLNAEAVVFNKASSGDFIAEMIVGLGVMDAIADRVQRFEDGRDAMEYLGKSGSDTALGFGQSTGLKVHEALGITVIGPLPEDIGNVTTYMAMRMPEAGDFDAAEALVEYLTNDAGRARFRETGVM
jgi:molybdate transport system substrate-binding protein